MASLNKPISTKLRLGDIHAFPAKTGVDIFQGSIAMLDAGFATYGQLGVNLVAVGRAENTVLSESGPGQILQVRSGEFQYKNDGSITPAHRGQACYVKDAETLTINSAGASLAGIITDVDLDGVWVKMGF